VVPVSTPRELDGKQDESPLVTAVMVTSEQLGLLVKVVPVVVTPVIETT
jgi:hypothetical protein